MRYKVHAHEGTVADVGLETFLNTKAAQGWRLVSTIAARDDKGPFRVLLIFEVP